MKSSYFLPRGVRLLLPLFLLTCNLSPQAFAQGGINPQGGPGETMRSLEQIEPRTPYSQENADSGDDMIGHTYLTEDITLKSETLVRGTLDLNGYGIYPDNSFSDDAALYGNTKIVVRNGEIRGFDVGIRIDAAAQVPAQLAVIENVTFTNIDVSGIQAAGSRAFDKILIRDCQFIGNVFSTAGIALLRVTTAVIDNCHFNAAPEHPEQFDSETSSSGDGIILGDNSLSHSRQVNVTVKNSSVNGAGSQGLEIDFYTNTDGHITIENCSFTDCRTAGVSNDFVFTPMTVIDSVAANNGGIGFFTNGPATFRGCTARNNGLDGFRGNGFTTYTNCVAQDNGDEGFQDNAGVLINNCESSFNKGDGYNVGVRSQIIDSKATWNIGTGFVVGSRSRISGCTASANGKSNSRTGNTANTSSDGASTGNDCMIIDSSFTDNRRAGLSVGGSNGLVDRVFIGANDESALRLNDDTITVKNSVINPQDNSDPEIVDFNGSAISGGDIAPIPTDGSSASHPGYNDN
jgi:hypothetical protein